MGEPASGSWDEAKDSRKDSGGAIDPAANARRLRLWRQSQSVTFVCAAMWVVMAGLLPVLDRWELEPGLIVLAIAVLAAGLALAPRLWCTTLLALFPILLLTVFSICLGGLSVRDIGEFLVRFFTDTSFWQWWLIRGMYLAMLALVLYRVIRAWGRSPADRGAIFVWWRKPPPEETPLPWS
ncbi:MAG: hypothetical protein ACREJ2_08025 [Planctomycetota bacterium]